MSNVKTTLPGSSEPLKLRPGLSAECQKDLDDALDETPTEEDVKKTWVEENRRDLLRAFATGRKVDPSPYKNIEVFSAVEGTEKDLRYTLVRNLIRARCEILELTLDAAKYIREIWPLVNVQ